MKFGDYLLSFLLFLLLLNIIYCYYFLKLVLDPYKNTKIYTNTNNNYNYKNNYTNYTIINFTNNYL